MAWVFRYVQNMRRKIKGEALFLCDLSLEEEENAVSYLCRHVQRQQYEDELEDLKKQHSVSQSSQLLSLNPFVGQDGLIRASGRIQNAAFLNLEARQPIILPKNHRFTRLLVEFYHRKFLHINTATAMSEIRQKYWVPSLRQLLNSIQSHCSACKLRRAKPRQPQM
uniref:Integrase zinc-binding domain-containing protein n=1 Tax=Stomoxys calcitrans TaxID=35570 RepID=A0A1I8PBF5_STOCA